jgi:hypothetical protein
MEEAMAKAARIVLTLIIVLGVPSAPVFAADKAPPPPVKAEAAGVSFEFAVSGDEAVITLKAKTTGWIAYGLDPENRMGGADIVIVYFKDGKAYARDDYADSTFGHRPDVSQGGTDDIRSVTGTEADGFTAITVRLPRLSKDAKDKKFTPGKHKLLLSYGLRDDPSAKHASRGSVDIDIPAP